MEISSSLCKLQVLPLLGKKKETESSANGEGGARRITAVSETIFEPKRRAESLEIERGRHEAKKPTDSSTTDRAHALGAI